jgi:hypothetical protein
MVPMEDIAAYVHDKVRLRGVPVPSEARDLRYRVLRAFRRHVPAEWSEEIEDMVEVVQGVGLRLNLRGGRASSVPARRRRSRPGRKKPESQTTTGRGGRDQ